MKKLISTVAILFALTSLYAQGVPDDPDIQVPVDGGIVTVVGVSIAYGIYRTKKERQD